MRRKDLPLYAAGHNQLGHLPNYRGEDMLVTRDWRRARDHLVEALCDDIPCPTYGDDCPDNLAADLRMAADEAAALQPDTPWRATVAGQAWWLASLSGHCPACGYRWPNVAGPSSISGPRTAAPDTDPPASSTLKEQQ